ncbi:kinesin-like protein KIN-14N [Nicotiana tomentosiformis]|uniref:kinesin-like protein KIN-14N n=1 Tax=Nicotiana tomentosiformis TaxID=4098 RepID=UPI00388C8461
MRAGHFPSLPTFSKEALREARQLKTPNIGGGSSVRDPFRDYFTGVDDASAISDASILLEEAQRLLSRAFAKFRADLSQCETELKKVSEERNALKLLCGLKDETIKDLQADLAKAREKETELDKQVSILLIKYGLDPTVEANTSLSQLQHKVERIELLRGEVDQVKVDCGWTENMDRLDAEKETTLAKVSSAKVQLRGIKEKSSSQAKRIEELEAGLAEAKAEIEKTKVMEDKSIAMYQANSEAAQMQLRESSDQINGSLTQQSVNLGAKPSRKSILEVLTSPRR